MRFLLFNVVVLGALFYLFTADKTDIRAATDHAHAVVSHAGSLADEAVDRVNSLMGRSKPQATTAVHETKPTEPAAKDAETAMAPAVPQRPAVSSAPEKTVAQDEPKSIPAPPAVPEIKESGRVGAPTRLAADEVPESWVPKRTNAKVDPTVTEKLLANSGAAVTGRPVEKPVASAPKADGGEKAEITIAKGEILMSPRERRKELAALAEDMELLSLKKLSR